MAWFSALSPLSEFDLSFIKEIILFINLRDIFNFYIILIGIKKESMTSPFGGFMTSCWFLIVLTFQVFLSRLVTLVNDCILNGESYSLRKFTFHLPCQLPTMSEFSLCIFFVCQTDTAIIYCGLWSATVFFSMRVLGCNKCVCVICMYTYSYWYIFVKVFQCVKILSNV